MSRLLRILLPWLGLAQAAVLIAALIVGGIAIAQGITNGLTLIALALFALFAALCRVEEVNR